MACLGAGLGLLLAWALTARGDPTGGMLPLFSMPARDLLIGAAIAVALGIVTGIFPAMNAMRLRVADALRRI
jgi:putative ABC transport system permease protein